MLKGLIVPIKKFSKGMLALMTVNFLVILSVFIFDSCKKTEYENSSAKEANNRFMSALQTNKKAISSISFSGNSKIGKPLMQNVAARYADPAPVPEEVTGYIQFPSDESTPTPTSFQEPETMEELVDLIHNTNAVLQYEPTPTNSDYQINLPVETIINTLNPLVIESKQYLYSKGLTEQDIQQMIQEENAAETDLIPLVMTLTAYENTQTVARNYLELLPINSAYAKLSWSDVGSCAMEAVGADALYALSQSTASVWSVAVIKSVFKKTVSKMLGPVGTAIAVGEFGWCLWRKS